MNALAMLAAQDLLALGLVGLALAYLGREAVRFARSFRGRGAGCACRGCDRAKESVEAVPAGRPVEKIGAGSASELDGIILLPSAVAPSHRARREARRE